MARGGAFVPSNIPVPHSMGDIDNQVGQRSYKELLEQGATRAQDGRGAVYSEADHRNFDRASGIAQATISTPADVGQAKVDPNVPVKSDSSKPEGWAGSGDVNNLAPGVAVKGVVQRPAGPGTSGAR